MLVYGLKALTLYCNIKRQYLLPIANGMINEYVSKSQACVTLLLLLYVKC